MLHVPHVHRSTTDRTEHGFPEQHVQRKCIVQLRYLRQLHALLSDANIKRSKAHRAVIRFAKSLVGNLFNLLDPPAPTVSSAAATAPHSAPDAAAEVAAATVPPAAAAADGDADVAGPSNAATAGDAFDAHTETAQKMAQMLREWDEEENAVVVAATEPAEGSKDVAHSAAASADATPSTPPGAHFSVCTARPPRLFLPWHQAHVFW